MPTDAPAPGTTMPPEPAGGVPGRAAAGVTDGMAPVVRLLGSLAAWVDANRSLIEEANALLDARAVASLNGEVLPAAAVEIVEALGEIADSSAVATELELEAEERAASHPADRDEPTPEQLAALMGRFGAPHEAPEGGGLGAAPAVAAASAPHAGDRFIDGLRDQFRAAADGTRLIARALRVELARRDHAERDGEALRSVQDIERDLRAARLETWPLLPSIVGVAEETVELTREAYRGMALASERIADLLDGSREDLILRREKPMKRMEFLAKCLAVFQNAAFHGSRDCQPGGPRACLAQDMTHRALRSLVSEDALGIYIKRFMRADEHASAGDVAHAHEQLEQSDARDKARLAEIQSGIAARRDGAAARDARRASQFRTVADALAAAEATFLSGEKARVVVTKQARDSAEDSPFLRPDEVFKFLQALQGTALAWSCGALPQGFNEALRPHGFGDRGISRSARTLYGRHYRVHWQGEYRLMGSHWTLGSRDANTCLSLHWYRDEERRLLVLGHCGIHLPNTLS